MLNYHDKQALLLHLATAMLALIVELSRLLLLQQCFAYVCRLYKPGLSWRKSARGSHNENAKVHSIPQKSLFKSV